METEVLPVQKISRQPIWRVKESLPKRLFDVFFSAAILIFLAPLLVGISLIIRLSSNQTV